VRYTRHGLSASPIAHTCKKYNHKFMPYKIRKPRLKAGDVIVALILIVLILGAIYLALNKEVNFFSGGENTAPER
jgi:hypothetical protein